MLDPATDETLGEIPRATREDLDDALADTQAMNHWIESTIRENPAQYLWVHKRFKTRPPGQGSLYG